MAKQPIINLDETTIDELGDGRLDNFGVAQLRELHDAEVAGKDRAGALELIDRAIKAQTPPEAGGTNKGAPTTSEDAVAEGDVRTDAVKGEADPAVAGEAAALGEVHKPAIAASTPTAVGPGYAGWTRLGFGDARRAIEEIGPIELGESDWRSVGSRGLLGRDVSVRVTGINTPVTVTHMHALDAAGNIVGSSEFASPLTLQPNEEAVFKDGLYAFEPAAAAA